MRTSSSWGDSRTSPDRVIALEPDHAEGLLGIARLMDNPHFPALRSEFNRPASRILVQEFFPQHFLQ